MKDYKEPLDERPHGAAEERPQEPPVERPQENPDKRPQEPLLEGH